MTIVEFIEARLDEDERAAQEAIDLEYCEPGFISEYEWIRHFRRIESGQCYSSIWIPGAPEPARVLRQSAAMRQLMELVDDTIRESPFLTGTQWMDLYKPTAAIWSDHPDYREEWRS